MSLAQPFQKCHPKICPKFLDRDRCIVNRIMRKTYVTRLENRIFLLPEAFCGLKHAENAIAAGAPDPAGAAHDAPPDLLVGWGVDTPPHTRAHSAPLARRCSCLGRLDRRAP